MTANDIAKYFINKAVADDDAISNMKLQKLVYYAQGIHLALYDAPLFSDRIKAWTYGPVVPQLYHDYKKHESFGIPADESFDMDSIDEETREFLDDIYDVIGQFSAVRLMQLSHTDQCWIDAHPDGEIAPPEMKKSMKKYIEDEA